ALGADVGVVPLRAFTAGIEAATPAAPLVNAETEIVVGKFRTKKPTAGTAGVAAKARPANTWSSVRSIRSLGKTVEVPSEVTIGLVLVEVAPAVQSKSPALEGGPDVRLS